MGNSIRRRQAVAPIALALALLFLVAAALALAGCSSNSPEGAVQSYFTAKQSLDWEGYKKAVAPQKLAAKDESLAKQQFNQIKVKFQDLKMQTQYNPKDKSKATVTLTGGKVTYTADILGKQQSDTQDITKVDPKDRPVFETVKVNGVWYVDTQLGL
jgi:hypothetical protein